MPNTYRAHNKWMQLKFFIVSSYLAWVKSLKMGEATSNAWWKQETYKPTIN